MRIPGRNRAVGGDFVGIFADRQFLIATEPGHTQTSHYFGDGFSMSGILTGTSLRPG
jgi:hypothetical protein